METPAESQIANLPGREVGGDSENREAAVGGPDRDLGAKMKSEGAAVKSADRVFDVIELLVGSDVPLSFAAIARSLNIPKSSLYHLLRNLLSRGYVEQEKDLAHYRPGPKLRDLAGRMKAPTLVDIVSPYVQSASRQHNETAAFYVRDGDRAKVACSFNGDQALNYSMRPGDAAPLHAVSAGRVILGAASPEALDDYMQNIVIEAYTAQTKTNPYEIRQLIEQAGQSGFAYSFEEYVAGIVGLAQAVRHDGSTVGAVTFAIPAARFNRERDLESRRILLSVASAIEKALDG